MKMCSFSAILTEFGYANEELLRRNAKGGRVKETVLERHAMHDTRLLTRTQYMGGSRIA